MEEEHNCTYVGSIGIQKSCDIIVNNLHALYTIDYTTIKNNTIIYVKPDFFLLFKEIVKNQLKNKVILVSGDSDYTIPTDFFTSQRDFLEFIENKSIIHWFSQNCIIDHPKITKLPIGLDYHTMTTSNHLDWGDVLTSIDQEKELIEIKEIGLPFYERIPRCYSNFHFFTKTRYGSDRINAMTNIPNELIYYEPKKLKRKESWLNQLKYAFVVCPHGNGLDTHRLYEALCLGCIPIVKTSDLDKLYEGLPVLIVQKWSDITELLLTERLLWFKNQEFQYNKLTLEYWVNLIKKYNG